MIPGLNTDVQHQGAVFHVQTEDMGRAVSWFESVVYLGGRILTKRRTSYMAALDEEDTTKALIAMMGQAHRETIQAIRDGKFDQKLTPTSESAAAEATEAESLSEPLPLVAETSLDDGSRAKPGPAEPEPTDQGVELPPKSGKPILFEDSWVGMDEKVVEYLNSGGKVEQPVLSMKLDRELVSGALVEPVFKVCSSLDERPIAAARVTAKLISTVKEPLTLATGETDSGGVAKLSFVVPFLQDGLSALIVTTTSEIGDAELKQLL